jgi:hypothetical protein
MASAVGPRSPEESRERTRFAAVSIGQTMRSVTTLAPELVAMSRNRLRCSSDLNDPTATTSLFVARECFTAAPITEYAYTIASLLRSPEAVRAAAPNCSAKVSDANLTAPHRSATRIANVDFPEPGIPQTIMRRGRPTLSSMQNQCQAAHRITPCQEPSDHLHRLLAHATGHAAAAPPNSVMNSRRFPAQCLPWLPAERLAHLGGRAGDLLRCLCCL